jgi:hypothetical protein
VKPAASQIAIDVKGIEQREGYQLQTVSMKSDGETTLEGVLAIPGSTPSPAVLLLDDSISLPNVDRLAKSGSLVLALTPRPTPVGTESIKSPYLGVFNLISMRAFLVGRTILGLRVDDVIRAVEVLAGRPDVDGKKISAYGNKALGMTLLHAAVLDTRINSVTVENSLASYRMIVDQPVHRNVSEIVVPGILRHYDVGDLLSATYPRQVTIIHPQDAMGVTLSDRDFQSLWPTVFQTEQKLGANDRLRFAQGLKDVH